MKNEKKAPFVLEDKLDPSVHVHEHSTSTCFQQRDISRLPHHVYAFEIFEGSTLRS